MMRMGGPFIGREGLAGFANARTANLGDSLPLRHSVARTPASRHAQSIMTQDCQGTGERENTG